jgi:tRNA(fMet)-specific endonuclease VapC
MKEARGYFWDTNILNYFRTKHTAISQHLAHVSWDKIFLPSVVVAESWRGRLRQADAVPKAEPELAVFPHRKLLETHNLLSQFKVISFDEKAADKLSELQGRIKNRKKRHADMMIAAMTLSNRFVLVTRNERDFSDLIPAQQLENWIDHPPAEA